MGETIEHLPESEREDRNANDATLCYMELAFLQEPECLYTVYQEFAGSHLAPTPNSNFLKGVKWSPDGCCTLTAADDNWLRLFDLPLDVLQRNPEQPLSLGVDRSDSLSPGLRVCEGECIYDYAWYPRMSAADPMTCVFAATSRGHPVHLWDAVTGALRASYRSYNDVDEISAAYSLAFSTDGLQLVTGHRRRLLLFDVGRPGRDCRQIETGGKGREGITGIISCLAYSLDASLLAAGSYSGAIGVFDARCDQMMMVMSGHKGGVTQVQFTPDSLFLISGARQDSTLLVWDARAAHQPLYTLTRSTATTNQRIAFDVEPCGRHLLTGGMDGKVEVFDLRDGSHVQSISVAADTVNGLSVHPSLPLLATASGHRRYPLSLHCDLDDSEDEGTMDSSDEEVTTGSPEATKCPRAKPTASIPADGLHNAFNIWKLPYHMVPFAS